MNLKKILSIPILFTIISLFLIFISFVSDSYSEFISYSTDFSKLPLQNNLDAPAGKHGWLEKSNGHFLFSDGTPVRFAGVNILASNIVVHKSKEQIDQTVDRLASLGVNMVRVHGLDAFNALGRLADPSIDSPYGYKIYCEICSNLTTEDSIDYVYAGNRSLKLMKVSEDLNKTDMSHYYGVEQHNSVVTASGRTFTASAMVKTSRAGIKVNISMIRNGGDYQVIGSTAVTSTGEWQSISITGTFNTSDYLGFSSRIYFSNHLTSEPGDIIYIDNWAVKEIGINYSLNWDIEDNRKQADATLDTLDYLISKLKKNGIYFLLETQVFPEWYRFPGYPYADEMNSLTSDRMQLTKRVTIFDPFSLELQKKLIAGILDHQNPYTGKRNAEDPVIALTDTVNEGPLANDWLWTMLDALPQGYKDELTTLWNNYAINKYGSLAAAVSLWQAGYDTTDQLAGITPIPASTNGIITTNVSTAGTSTSKNIYWSQLNLPFGLAYRFTFDINAENAQDVQVAFVENNPNTNYQWLNSKTVSVPAGNATMSVEFNFITTFVEQSQSIRIFYGAVTGQMQIQNFQLKQIIPSSSLMNDAYVSLLSRKPLMGWNLQMKKDWLDFLSSLQQTYDSTLKSYFRQLGWGGLLLSTQADSPYHALKESEIVDVIDTHKYHDHPRFPVTEWSTVDWNIRNKSMVDSDTTMPQRIKGVPLMVTEYNHPFPNEYDSETIPFAFGISALQDYDGMLIHDIAPLSSDNFAGKFFNINGHLGKMALWPIGINAFLRGDISPHKEECVLSIDMENALEIRSQGLPLNINRLFFGCKVTVDPANTDNASYSLNLPVNTENVSYDGRLMVITSPKTIIITGYVPGGDIPLGPFMLHNPGAEQFASLGITSLDNKPLTESKWVLIAAAGTTRNTDMIWNAKHNSVNDNWGTAPVQTFVPGFTIKGLSQAGWNPDEVVLSEPWTFLVSAAPPVVVIAEESGNSWVKKINSNTGEVINQFRAFGSGNRSGSVNFAAIKDLNGNGYDDIITGQEGGDSWVSVYDGNTNENLLSFQAFGTGNKSGTVRVASIKDINGDGYEDIVTAQVQGSSWVNLFDGKTGINISSFQAFGAGNLSGSVRIGVIKDINGNGFDDIVTGQEGGASWINIYDGKTSLKLSAFQSFGAGNVSGSVRFALGDTDGDGAEEIIAGQDDGGDSWVCVYESNGTKTNDCFQAFVSGNSRGAVRLAAGDVDGDGSDEIIAGHDVGGDSWVCVFEGDGIKNNCFQAFDADYPNPSGAVRLYSKDTDGDGRDEIFTGQGAGGDGYICVFNGEGIKRGCFKGLDGWSSSGAVRFEDSIPYIKWERPRDPLVTKVTKIGFNSEYLRDVPHYQNVLKKISEDGFKYIRFYELFFDDNTYKSIFTDLDTVISNNLTPFISLSNYPLSLKPDQPTWNGYPQDEIDKILTYSNRYMPYDLPQYANYLRNFLSELDNKYDTESWFFEIGNEPNAPRYFWGTNREYENIYNSSIPIIRETNVNSRAGAGGFSFLTLSDNNYLDYFDTAIEISKDRLSDFLSFHLYFNNNKIPSKKTIRQFTNHSKLKIISEWNVSSQGGQDIDNIIDSKDYLKYLIHITDISYDSNIDYLYIHSLMDHPNKGFQLGLFDKQGNPKVGYEYVKLIKDIVEAGYIVDSTDDLITIKGNNKFIAMSKDTENIISYSGYNIIDSSFDYSINIDINSKQLTLPPNEWVVLDTAHPPVTTASPIGGTYPSAQTVILTSNETATIYYTTDGSTPDITSLVYSLPITISNTITLKFFSVDNAGNEEEVKTESYIINLPNNPPTITTITSQSTDEDIAKAGIAFTIGDAETLAGNLRLAASSSNTTLIPQSNIQLGGEGTNRTITLTPALNQVGTSTITLTVTDEGRLTAESSFVLTVNPVNDAPIAINDNYSVNEDIQLSVNAANGVLVNDSDPDGGTITAFLVSSTANGILSLNTDGSFTYTPNANFYGSDSFTYKAKDTGGLYSSEAAVTITVNHINQPPVVTLTSDKTSVMEVEFPVRLTVKASDPDGDPVTLKLFLNGGVGAGLAPAQIVPIPNGSGELIYDYTPSDGTAPLNGSVNIELYAEAASGTHTAASNHLNVTVFDTMKGDSIVDNFIGFSDLFDIAYRVGSNRNDGVYNSLLDFNNDGTIDKTTDIPLFRKVFFSGPRIIRPSYRERNYPIVTGKYNIRWFAKDPSPILFKLPNVETALQKDIEAALSATANVVGLKIDFALYNADGSFNRNIFTSIPNMPFASTWDTTTIVNGNYLLEIKAYDDRTDLPYKGFDRTGFIKTPVIISNPAVVGSKGISSLLQGEAGGVSGNYLPYGDRPSPSLVRRGSVLSSTDSNISANITELPGGQIKAEILVSALADLHNFSFDITFDPTKLAAVSVEEGSLLKGNGETIFISDIDNETGRVSIGAVLLGRDAGVNEGGNAANIIFTVKTAEKITSNALSFENADLRNSKNEDIVDAGSGGGNTSNPDDPISDTPSDDNDSTSGSDPVQKLLSEGGSGGKGCFIGTLK